jgi:hypothetical protein
MRNGSPEFYALLEKAGEIHNLKSHDYANNNDPFGNYHFAGKLSKLFDNPDDTGFVGRIGEKLFRLANLENGDKKPLNESIEDTELDLIVIMTLWMADRRTRRYQVPYHNRSADGVPGILKGNIGPIEIPKGY